MDRKTLNERLPILRATFDLLANPDDWKAPVRRAVALEDMQRVGAELDTLAEACVHYTATLPTCREIRDEHGALAGYWVEAAGYRASQAW